MRIDVLTAVPELFASPLQASILKRAQQKGLVTIGIHNLHDWGRKGRIDDYLYGGGAGMAIRVDVVVAAMRDLSARYGPYEEVIYLTADGEKKEERRGKVPRQDGKHAVLKASALLSRDSLQSM